MCPNAAALFSRASGPLSAAVIITGLPMAHWISIFQQCGYQRTHKSGQPIQNSTYPWAPAWREAQAPGVVFLTLPMVIFIHRSRWTGKFLLLRGGTCKIQKWWRRTDGCSTIRRIVLISCPEIRIRNIHVRTAIAIGLEGLTCLTTRTVQIDYIWSWQDMLIRILTQSIGLPAGMPRGL